MTKKIRAVQEAEETLVSAVSGGIYPVRVSYSWAVSEIPNSVIEDFPEAYADSRDQWRLQKELLPGESVDRELNDFE